MLFQLTRFSLEDAKSWGALKILYCRSWWGRIWVLQETAVGPQDPIVGVGHKWLSWVALESARKFVEEQIKNYTTNEAIWKMIVNVVKRLQWQFKIFAVTSLPPYPPQI